MNYEKELAALWREMKDLRASIAQRPLKAAPGSTSTYVQLRIIDGNTVFSSGGTTYYGIKRTSSTLTTVSSLWDPTSVGTTAGLFSAEDFIGRAFLYINGTLQASAVLVVLDASSPISTALVQDNTCVAVGTKTLTLASDSTQSVTAYIPLFR